jgi:RNA polymerase sigma-70 factor (ECF subfamily)
MAKQFPHADTGAPAPASDPWVPSSRPGSEGSLADFHAGTREAFTAFYRDHFSTVDRAVGRILSGADKETVVHEIFLRVMTKAELRLAFRGGSMTAWLAAVARNHAIDYTRHHRLEQPSGAELNAEIAVQDGAAMERRVDARILVDRFRREYLPAKWEPVFELRFLRHIGQEQAARQLGIGRTTLAYREHRIKALLRRFLLKVGRP